jgi:hypothetical protein
MSLPEGRAGRLLALAILALLLAAAGQGLVRPLLELHAAREADLARQRELVERYRTVAGELAELRRSLPAGVAAAAARTLPGANDAVAAAELLTLVQATLAAQGGVVASAETLPAETLDGFRRIGVRITTAGRQDYLARALAALAGAAPLLTVEGLQVTAERPGAAGGRAEPELRIGFEVFGYRQS